uniref:Uncharacterized protein n=1 Tax=Geospiza parvula TaxID=87175 RepID=A0A8U8AVB0_GEOPR
GGRGRGTRWPWHRVRGVLPKQCGAAAPPPRLFGPKPRDFGPRRFPGCFSRCALVCRCRSRPLLQGTRSPNATEPRGSRSPSWLRRGKGLSAAGFWGWAFLRASEEAAERARCCSGKVRTAPGEACPCPGCGRGLGVPGLRVPTLSRRLGLSPTPLEGRHCPRSRGLHRSSGCPHIWGMIAGFSGFSVSVAACLVF